MTVFCECFNVYTCAHKVGRGAAESRQGARCERCRAVLTRRERESGVCVRCVADERHDMRMIRATLRADKRARRESRRTSANVLADVRTRAR